MEFNIFNIDLGAIFDFKRWRTVRNANFIIEHEGAPVRKGLFWRTVWSPKRLTVYFKKIDAKNAIINYFDSNLSRNVQLDLFKIEPDLSRSTRDENGINLTALMLNYLKAEAASPMNMHNCISLNWDSKENREFESKDCGTYLILFIVQRNDAVPFCRRQKISHSRNYDVKYRQDPDRDSLSDIRERKK